MAPYRIIKRYAVYDALKVQFNTGKGFLSDADKKANKKEQVIPVQLDDNQIKRQTIEDSDYADKEAKTVMQQTIGLDEKITGNESGREVKAADGESLVPPAAEAGKPANEFKGWNTDPNATAPMTDDDLEQVVFKDDTTFYAIYGPKDQGKLNVKYVYNDGGQEKDIDAKYRMKGQEYASTWEGDFGTAVDLQKASTVNAPKFIGFVASEVKSDPENAQLKYLKDNPQTLIFVYNKLDTIIPEKTDDGNTNPKVDQTVKDTYVKVTYNKGEYGKLYVGDTAPTDQKKLADTLVYYVNPKEGIQLKDVAKVHAKADKDYVVDTTAPWKFAPETISSLDQVVANNTDQEGDDVQTEITLTAQYSKTLAKQFADKLEAQDIKVWKDADITWKDGVKLKDGALQGEFDKAKFNDINTLEKDKVKLNDQGQLVDEKGTAITADTLRSSAKAQKDPFTGGILVTFSDKSSLVIEGQKLYVAETKVKEGDDNNPASDNLPADKIKAELKLGKGTQIEDVLAGTEKGALYATFYLKPNTKLDTTDFPAVEAQPGYKEGSVKWMPDNGNLAPLTQDTVYTATATAKTIAEKVGDDVTAVFVPVDIAVWEGTADTAIPWKEGVKVADTVTDAEKKVEFQGYLDGAKSVEDATTPKRTAAKAEGSPFTGTLTVTFSDKSFVEIPKHNLYVWKVKTENNDTNKDQPKPKHAVRVSFAKGAGVTALDPANKTMTVKSGTTLETGDFPTATVDTAKGYKTPATWKGQDANAGLTVSENNKVFTATAEKDKSTENVIPYTPADPKKPADPQDKNIPTEDKDHKTIDKKDYVVVGFNVAPENAGTLTLGTVAKQPAIAALVKKDTLWSAVTLPTATAANKYTFWYWSDAPADKVADGQVRTAHFVTTGTEIGEKEKDKPLPADFVKATIAKGDGVKNDKLFGKSYAVKKGDSLAKGKFPTLAAEDNYKNPKWYQGETAVKDNQPEAVKISAETTFTAKAVSSVLDKNNLTGIEVVKDPTTMTYTEGDKPNYDGIKVKITDKNGNSLTIEKGKLQEYGVTLTPTEDTPLTITDHNGKHLTAQITVNGKPVTAESKGTFTVNKAPSKDPVITQPTEGDKIITGKGENGAEIVVKGKDGKEIGKTTVKDGKWEVTVPEGNDLKTGDKITVTQTEPGKAPTDKDTTVKDKEKSASPDITQPTEGDKTITGKGVKDAEIVVKDKDGKEIGKTKVKDDGSWEVTLPEGKDLQTGDKITVTQTEPGKKPNPVEVTVKAKRAPGGGGGTVVIPSQPDEKPDVKPGNKPGEGDLNKDDHYQYLIGYPDGTFGPNRGMTRAEVATMFTRLLKDRPVKGESYTSNFTDVNAGDWYANTVGYAVQKGIVSGYPDGSFKPNQAITRAEFSAIAARFAGLTDEKDLTFTDLDASHWGYKAIRLAASHGWISGYPDNTFRPAQDITRAEVTSITNRMLNRYADLDWLDANMDKVTQFSDVARSDWFFEPIMEAVVSHNFTRDADGKHEHWTGLNSESFI
ncbi:S-layer homology domain-containing protein [Peptococcus simiae]|uniref:S-layer homology domain-containing protein n=1 Tax=Peptococcus simiae TaxID=1643805 RepID=A0ABW9GVJ8_9FIRM